MKRSCAQEDLNERIAAYQLVGWRLVWKSTGEVWSAFMACMTDGVMCRIIKAGGETVSEYRRCKPTEETDAAPVHGPVAPTPKIYTTESDAHVLVAWADVWRLARNMPGDTHPDNWRHLCK